MLKTEVLANENQADFAGNTLNAINKEMMRLNELGLARANAAVDFDGVGTMPERMDRMLSALAEGLACLGISPVMATLGIFPVIDRSKTIPAMLFYSHQGGSDDSTFGRRYAFQHEARPQSYRLNDEEILTAFVGQLRDLVGKTSEGRGVALDIVAAPYYVRSSGSDFNIEDHIFSRFYYCGPLSTPTWPWLGSPQVEGREFLQKLVLYLLVPRANDSQAIVDRHGAILDSCVRNALGAFLSSAGVNAEENSILFAQRVACHSLLRAHEIANETRELLAIQLDLQDAFSTKVSDGDKQKILMSFRESFERLLEDVNRLQGTGEDASLKPIDWRRVIELWCRARKWRADANGVLVRHSLGHNEQFMTGAELRLDFTGVAAGVSLLFVPAYLDRVLDILTRNIADAWKPIPEKRPEWSGPKIIEISARQRNGSLVLVCRSTGPKIPPTRIQRLFREVVKSDTPGKGTGLWALGLAFCSHGLPYPVIRNLDEWEGSTGIEIEMTFPVATR
jgi:hypothetical protein